MKTPHAKKALFVEPTHGRTESSSGGLGDSLSKADPTATGVLKKPEEIASLARLKEENEDLLSRLRCARDTVAALNAQVTERDQEFAEAKIGWDKREQELLKQLERLSLENDTLKESAKTHANEIKELKENYATMRKLYEFEESKTKRNAKIISELQARYQSTQSENAGRPRTPTGSKFLTSRATEAAEFAYKTARADTIAVVVNEDQPKMITKKKSEHSKEAKMKASNRVTIGGMKTPQVKPIAKGMLYNPLNSFF